jgi:hypothetical protein
MSRLHLISLGSIILLAILVVMADCRFKRNKRSRLPKIPGLANRYTYINKDKI